MVNAEAARVLNRVSNGACPMEGCRGDWKHYKPFLVHCTIDPTHVFRKEHLMAGKAMPIIEADSRDSS